MNLTTDESHFFRRLKDDTIKCRLAERATLNLLVEVHDPSKSLAYILNERRSLRAVARQIASPGTILGRSAVSRCDTSNSAASEATWIYDHTKAAVVRSRRDAVEEAREEGENLVLGLHPGGILQVGSTGIEATPVEPTPSSGTSRQAKQDSCREARAHQFETKVEKNDSHETHSTGSISSCDESLDDSLDDTCDGESDFTSSQFSRYTEVTETSESDLAVLLRKISSRWRPSRGKAHQDDGSVNSCDDSTDVGYTKDATELARNSTKFQSGRIAAFARAKDAIVPPKSNAKRGWTSRLICCAGPGDAELLSSAIHEDPGDDNRERLGRGRSEQSAGTDHTPW